MYRIGQRKYGPFNPRLRGHGTDRSSWSRWDTADGRTIYAASTVEAAFGEVLPYLRENLPTTPLADLFDDVQPDEVGLTLADKVRAEMPAAPMRDAVNRGWREARLIYGLTLPTDGWFIDISAAESLAAINSAVVPTPAVSLSDLTGEDRGFTTKVAGWARSQILDDGSLPLGIRYLSKHGSNMECYAVWLRALDDDKPLGSEPTKLKSETLIPLHQPDLCEVAGRLRMNIF